MAETSVQFDLSTAVLNQEASANFKLFKINILLK